LRDPAFGGSITALVTDAADGSVLLDRQAATPMVPASTVKVLTAAAALSTLGPVATLTTRVLRAGPTLYLVGGGDVTLLARPLPAAGYPRPATLSTLAAATVRAGAVGVTRVCADTSAWTGPAQAPGWKPGYLTAGDVSRLAPLEVDEARLTPAGRARDPRPVAQALSDFAGLLRTKGLTVSTTGCRGPAPSSAVQVAAVHSPAVAALVARMLTVSDNDLAEALGRAVAAHGGGPASFAGAAAAVTAAVRALGVDVSGLVLHDTSGLSPLDRVSATTLVGVVRAAVRTDALRPLLAGLPVAAATGTLGDRYRGHNALAGAGVVRAKTGTLAGVNTLAGAVVDADGRLLVFAFLTGRAASPDAAEAALDRLAAVLARCGCR
jgi:D-alanyl-D-alanine carboxypeptidase/D-alanyl-D-alanine-endopeptidase (penicillin-binding protein 4)